MKRTVYGFLASLVLLLAAGCMDNTPPPMPRIQEVPAQSFTQAWSLDLAAGNPKLGVEWARLAGDYLIVFGGTNREAFVIRKADGTLASIDPIHGRGPVLAPFTNGQQIGYPVATGVEVFDVAGQPQRPISLGQSSSSTGTFSASRIYIGVAGLNGGRILSMDPKRTYDSPVWQILAFGPIQSAPVFMDGTLYFATRDGHIYAVNENGQPMWAMDKGYFEAGPVVADLVADDFGLYIASTDTKLLCLNRDNGRVRWQYYAQTPLTERPSVTADTVYLATRSDGLMAVSKRTGDFNRHALWTNHEATKFLAEDERFAYALMKNNAIAALDRKTGAVAFRSPPSGIDYFVSNEGKDAMIYGVTKKGYAIAIRPVVQPGTMGSLLFTK